MYKLELRHINGRIIFSENRFGELLFPDGSLRKKVESEAPALLQSESVAELIEYARAVIDEHPLVTATVTSPDGSKQIIEDADAIDDYTHKQAAWYDERTAKWRWQIAIVEFFRGIFRKNE